MPALILYAESTWVSPWVFHAMVALEEKRLSYELVLPPLPLPAPLRAELAAKAVIPKVPVLVHGTLWLTESLAISEYLAETFRAPDYPRLFPADLAERARARQIMSWLRTSLGALRAERPTTSVFGRQAVTPLTTAGQEDAAELLRVASAVVPANASQMFADWSIADADLALALMRLVANQDPVPEPLVHYARAQWERPSVQRYLGHASNRP